ncbi:MAG: deoxyguanosinetriphosphate triphosphohydrolase [Patescibacteria group bacterium]
MILTRKELEENEAKVLAPYAVQSRWTRGRKFEEAEDTQRLPFQKDRDRIIHTRAFRRLKAKTQVFVDHYGDHYRTRLSHSLEVAQVSRDLARNLGLNEDLAEAISLAHDLGHTPFGHAGEFALHECLQSYGLHFEHNEQSRRVVEELEQIYPNHPGLNLSIETLEGLMKHQTSWDNPMGAEEIRPSLEAQIVNLGDEIAYQNHDVDDGLRSGLFTEEDLKPMELWQRATEETERIYGKIEDDKIRFSRTISKMIGLMIKDITVATSERLKTRKIKTLEDVYACKAPLVYFSEPMGQANKKLKEFLLMRLYYHPEVQSHMMRGQAIIKKLFTEKMKASESKERAAELRDYLAGMTDRYAELQFEQFSL